GGGNDLVFPHHENEIAQSEGATGEPLARYWLHNGMVNLGGEKMAKSKGRVVDLASIVEAHGGRALRMLYVRAHYRSPIEYSDDLLVEAGEALDRLDRFRSRTLPGPPDQRAMERFTQAMDEDFGTPDAVSLLFELVREGNRILDEGGDASAIAGAVEEIVGVLGLDAGSRPMDSEPALSDSEVEALVEQRQRARDEGRYEYADAIRDELAENRVILEDSADGTRWLRR
ncbi:MAG: DALR domain-containing protein, partial [Acidimicrobiia bacterium]|nr:DALR domain-containing protein [Acidimicrobiia bacterium]